MQRSKGVVKTILRYAVETPLMFISSIQELAAPPFIVHIRSMEFGLPFVE